MAALAKDGGLKKVGNYNPFFSYRLVWECGNCKIYQKTIPTKSLGIDYIEPRGICHSVSTYLYSLLTVVAHSKSQH